jgi:DNA-binding NarL/FixJ family response regulator
VGIAYNRRTAIRQLEITKPDVLLMDLMLPGLRSIEVLSYVSGTQPDVKILAMVPGDPPHDRIMMAIQAGALGFVSKDAEPTEMFAAMKQVLRGEVYLPIDETYDVLQQAAPELVVSNREKRARFFQALVGFIPIAGIISALTEFLWREYWGQIGVRVTDLGVDASSRVEFIKEVKCPSD